MSRCVEMAALAAALMALAGCATLPARLSRPSILGGYKLMDAPAAEVPIGAEWRQGYGPVGPGATAENLVTKRSFSSLTLSRSARRGLEVRLADYLGLEPDTEAKLSATVSEISVASVRDPRKLGLGAGKAYLSDAMKASRITVTTSSEAGADLASSVEARGLRVLGKASANGEETLVIEGADLFFAYRVTRLEAPENGNQLLGRVLKRPHAPGW